MELDVFLENINYGYDGYLVEVTFFDLLRKAKIVTSIYIDEDKDGNLIWVNLEINLINIKEGKFLKTFNAMYARLSDGIKYKKFNAHHFIAFTLNDDHHEIHDIEQFKETDIYFECEGLSYEIKPYDKKYAF